MLSQLKSGKIRKSQFRSLLFQVKSGEFR